MAEKSPAFPNTSIDFNTKEFIVESLKYTTDEIGQIVLEMCSDLHDGRFNKVDKLTFVDRIYVGTCIRKSIPTSLREEIKSRGKCKVCGSSKNLEIDHLIPVSKGGSSAKKNLQLLCFKCNRSKSDKNMNQWMKEIGEL